MIALFVERHDVEDGCGIDINISLLWALRREPIVLHVIDFRIFQHEMCKLQTRAEREV